MNVPPVPSTVANRWISRGAIAVLAACIGSVSFGAIKKVEGPIPELRPPKGPLPLELPEGAIFASALGFAFAVLIVGRVRQARRPPPPMPAPLPLATARASLGSVNGPDALQQCGRVLRRYLEEAFGIGPDGASAGELYAQFTAHSANDPESATALENFLNEVELARFAPSGVGLPPEDCIARTLELLETLERRRNAAKYPALPVVT
jgi:hypothetical protein